MLLLPALGVVAQIITDNLADYRFVVPLTGGYFVQRLDQGPGSSPQMDQQIGPYQIFLLNPGESLYGDPEFGQSKLPTSSFVPNVHRIAVVAKQLVVIGTMRADFFVLDARSGNLQLFNSAAEFNAAIKAVGASSVPLNDPAVMAKSLPRSTIRPWAYQQMNGLLGLSDVAWSGIAVDIGGMIALAGGLAIPRVYRWKTKWVRRIVVFFFAAGLGMVVNGFANGWLLDGGPDALVGLITLPPGYVIAAILGGSIPVWVCAILSHVLRKHSPNFKAIARYSRSGNL
ncbi:MAG TPA: hypothetical protein VHX86_01240 [Tepidisphaeraceae bacterium]|jgi:hypothetical protein|nr:hypothetical protein [Tepidisphaeraceae bacterium]